MASQGFEGDVPIENIEAVYPVERVGTETEALTKKKRLICGCGV